LGWCLAGERFDLVVERGVALVYNDGGINEAERKMDEAHVCYTNILKDHLNYVDCYLGFGCLARDRGNILQVSYSGIFQIILHRSIKP